LYNVGRNRVLKVKYFNLSSDVTDHHRFSAGTSSKAENSDTTTTNTKAEEVTSPKPALPPKPSPSAFKKGNVNQIKKLNSTSVGITTTGDSLISSASVIFDPKSLDQSDRNEQSLKNVHLKSTCVAHGDQIGTAPVAIIDEFDNLSDLNSPSPVRHKEVSTPSSNTLHERQDHNKFKTWYFR
jgi:hypothetical protein